MEPRTYTVKYERDRDGWWVAQAVGVSAATQGRTIEQTRDRIREAIAVALDVDTELVLIGREHVRLPAESRRALKSMATATAKAKRQAVQADRAVRVAARQLTKAGLSLRDTGTLLGVTRQRVHQLLLG